MAQERCETQPNGNPEEFLSSTVEYPKRRWRKGSIKEVLDGLDHPGSLLDLDTYVSLLQWCGNAKSLMSGIRLHSHIIERGLEHSNLLGHLILQMYGNCGEVQNAQVLFANMPERSVYVWNVMIKVYLKNRQRERAFQLFNQMEQGEVELDRATFVSILSAYASQEALAEGKQMHTRIASGKFGSNVVVGTAIVNMYGKCGDLDNAQRVFNEIIHRDVITWNAMIAVYVQHGKDSEALQLFNEMQHGRVMPNRITFLNTLGACASHAILTEGQQLHAQIMVCGCQSDMVVGTALVNMYGKCGSPNNAKWVFERMLMRDVVSWNAMTRVYTHNGLVKEAIQVFNQMQQIGVIPDKVTFSSVLDACADQAALAEGQHIHVCAVSRGFQSDIVVGTALMNMYGKCGNMEAAQKVFNNMLDRDVVSWNAILAAYAQHEQGMHAHQFFAHMQLEGVLPCNATFVSVLSAYANEGMLAEGERLHVCIVDSDCKSDLNVGNALVSMYGKCGRLDDAQKVFDRLSERDVVSWNAIIMAYSQNEQGKEAWYLFEQMQQEGLLPDNVTFLSILDACSSQAGLARGKQVHSYVMANHLESDIFIATALISMYGKCGSLKSAQRVFDHIQKQTVVPWNAMIAAHARHGQAKEAIRHFYQMKHKIMPDIVTFTILLTACSHVGLVDEACQLFSSIIQDHDIVPATDHYACMIDLLGRAGRLDEAENLLKNAACEPNVVLYMTLLGACRYQVDVDRGERAANRVFELDQDDPAPFVMLSNIYAAAGREVDAAKVISRMHETRLQQKLVSEASFHEVLEDNRYTMSRNMQV